MIDYYAHDSWYFIGDCMICRIEKIIIVELERNNIENNNDNNDNNDNITV